MPRTLKIRGTPDDILARVLAPYRANAPWQQSECGLMRMNNVYGFVFGAGLVMKYFDAYYDGDGKGWWKIGRLAARYATAALADGRISREFFMPVQAQLIADGREVPFHGFTLILASTVAHALLGIRVNYRAGERSDAFHIVASGNGRRDLARQFPKALLGRPLSGPNHFDDLAREVEIAFLQPTRIIFDGEVFEGDRVRLAHGIRLRVIRP